MAHYHAFTSGSSPVVIGGAPVGGNCTIGTMGMGPYFPLVWGKEFPLGDYKPAPTALPVDDKAEEKSQENTVRGGFSVNITTKGASPRNVRILLHDPQHNVRAVLGELKTKLPPGAYDKATKQIFIALAQNAPLQRVMDEALHFAKRGNIVPVQVVIKEVLSPKNAQRLGIDPGKAKEMAEALRTSADQVYYSALGSRVIGSEITQAELVTALKDGNHISNWRAVLDGYIAQHRYPDLDIKIAHSIVNKLLTGVMDTTKEGSRTRAEFADRCLELGFSAPAVEYIRSLGPNALSYAVSAYYKSGSVDLLHEALLVSRSGRATTWSRDMEKIDRTIFSDKGYKERDEDRKLLSSNEDFPEGHNPERYQAARSMFSSGILALPFSYGGVVQIKPEHGMPKIAKFIKTVATKGEEGISELLQELARFPNAPLRGRILTSLFMESYEKANPSIKLRIVTTLANHPDHWGEMSSGVREKLYNDLTELAGSSADLQTSDQIALHQAISNSIQFLVGRQLTLPSEANDRRALALAPSLRRVSQNLNPENRPNQNDVDQALTEVAGRLSITFYSEVDGSKYRVPVSAPQKDILRMMAEQGLPYAATDALLEEHLALNLQKSGPSEALELAVSAAEKGFLGPVRRLVTSIEDDPSDLNCMTQMSGTKPGNAFASKVAQGLQTLHPSDHQSFIIDSVWSEAYSRARLVFSTAQELSRLRWIGAAIGWFFGMGIIVNEARKAYAERYDREQKRLKEEEQAKLLKKKGEAEKIQRQEEQLRQLQEQEQKIEKEYLLRFQENFKRIPDLREQIDQSKEKLHEQLKAFPKLLFERLEYDQAYRPSKGTTRHTCKEAGSFENAASWVLSTRERWKELEETFEDLYWYLAVLENQQLLEELPEGDLTRQKIGVIHSDTSKSEEKFSVLKELLEHIQEKLKKIPNQSELLTKITDIVKIEEIEHEKRRHWVEDRFGAGGIKGNTLPVIGPNSMYYKLLLKKKVEPEKLEPEGLEPEKLEKYATNVFKDNPPTYQVDRDVSAIAKKEELHPKFSLAARQKPVTRTKGKGEVIPDGQHVYGREYGAETADKIGAERAEAERVGRRQAILKANLFYQAADHYLLRMTQILERQPEPNSFEEQIWQRELKFVVMRLLTALTQASKGEENLNQRGEDNVPSIAIFNSIEDSKQIEAARNIFRHRPWAIGDITEWAKKLVDRLGLFKKMRNETTCDPDENMIKLPPSFLTKLQEIAPGDVAEDMPLNEAERLMTEELAFISQIQEKHAGQKDFALKEQDTIYYSINCITQLVLHPGMRSWAGKYLNSTTPVNQNLGHAFLPLDKGLQRVKIRKGEYVTQHNTKESKGRYIVDQPLSPEMLASFLSETLPAIGSELDKPRAALTDASPNTIRRKQTGASTSVFE